MQEWRYRWTPSAPGEYSLRRHRRRRQRSRSVTAAAAWATATTLSTNSA
ncbi:MAG: hypothetical protein R2856_30710 [Caldilineaceae bacterium]